MYTFMRTKPTVGLKLNLSVIALWASKAMVAILGEEFCKLTPKQMLVATNFIFSLLLLCSMAESSPLIALILLLYFVLSAWVAKATKF